MAGRPAAEVAGRPAAEGGGPTGPRLSVAGFAGGPSSTIKRATWLNAAGMLGGAPQRIIRYDWDLNGDGRFGGRRDASCGPELPAISHPFNAPGVHTIGLRVTNAVAQTDTARVTVTVPRTAINALRGAEGVFACENPGADNQPDRADCIKTIAFGMIEVNSRGKAGDCFVMGSRLVTLPRGALAAQQVRSFVYTATIKGPVALNGLLLPIPAGVESDYDSLTKSINIPSVPVWFGRYRTKVAELTRRQIEPDNSGRYHLVDVPLSSAFELAGLKLESDVSFDLVYRASKTRLTVALPKVFTIGRDRGAQGWLEVTADNHRGVRFEGARLRTGLLYLGPVRIGDLSFTYRDERTWEGGAALELPGGLVAVDANQPPPEWGIGLRDGRLAHAGGGVRIQPPAAPQLFPGVFLTHFGVGIGSDPVRFTGIAGINVAKTYEIAGELFAVFPPAGRPYVYPSENASDELAFLAGRRLDATTIALAGRPSSRCRWWARSTWSEATCSTPIPAMRRSADASPST